MIELALYFAYPLLIEGGICAVDVVLEDFAGLDEAYEGEWGVGLNI